MKDYEKAAAVVRRMVERGDVPDIVTLEVMGTFIELFTGDNPRFDRERFTKACIGVKEES